MTALAPWPTCPTCGDPYELVIGLPVVIGPADRSHAAAARYVAVAVDSAEVCWDESASVACSCGPVDERLDDAALDALAEALRPTLEEVAAARPVTALLDRSISR